MFVYALAPSGAPRRDLPPVNAQPAGTGEPRGMFPNVAPWIRRYAWHMANVSQLAWGMLFGAIGLGFFIYGKRQRAPVPLLTGVALSVFPYFVSNTYLLVLIGAALVALPYFVSL
jgi:hypothetical protein